MRRKRERDRQRAAELEVFELELNQGSARNLRQAAALDIELESQAEFQRSL